MKNLIGKKVRGFEFNATDIGLFFVDEMTEYNVPSIAAVAAIELQNFKFRKNEYGKNKH